MSWTDERVEILTRLWAEGKSASQIAEILGDVSRNAVIGKAHRLGLSGRPSPIKRKSSKKEKKGISILDLNERVCRWPHGDPRDDDFHFCGKPSVPGLPYCAEHCAVAYQATTNNKKKEDTAALSKKTVAA